MPALCQYGSVCDASEFVSMWQIISSICNKTRFVVGGFFACSKTYLQEQQESNMKDIMTLP